MSQYHEHMKEADLQEKVIALAKARGWMVMHSRPARTEKGWRTPITGDVGFPDLVLARNGQVIFAELKSESGRETRQQREWIHHLIGPCHSVYVWRPKDWPTIEEVLA